MKLNTILKSTITVIALGLTLSVSNLPLLAKEGENPKTSAQAAAGVPKGYPLRKCVVSDDPLGDHGKPVKVTAPDGTDVYLCCKDCVKDFKKDPAKYAKMVRDAAPKK